MKQKTSVQGHLQLRVITVLMMTAVLANTTHSTRLQHSSNICTAKAGRVSVLEVMNLNQRFDLNIGNDFKYVQVSMKIERCYSQAIFRGNKFFTNNTLKLNQQSLTLPMNVSYEFMNGTHAYHVSIDTQGDHFSSDVDTHVKCGKCRGFKVKAVGATICSLGTHNESPPQLSTFQTSKFSISSNTNKDEIDLPTSIKMVSRTHNRNQEMVDLLHKMRKWVNVTSVAAIFLTLSAFVIFLVVTARQKRPEYRILDDRVTPEVSADIKT